MVFSIDCQNGSGLSCLVSALNLRRTLSEQVLSQRMALYSPMFEIFIDQLRERGFIREKLLTIIAK